MWLCGSTQLAQTERWSATGGGIVSSPPCRSTMSLGMLFGTSPQIVLIWPLIVVNVEVDKVQTEAVKPGSAAVLRRPNHNNAPSSKMLRLVLKSYIASGPALAF